MNRIYIAICLNGRRDWFKRQNYLQLIKTVSSKIHEAGLVVVNLNTSGVVEYPNAGIFECVRFSDKVICICDESSLGFGGAWPTMLRLSRSGIAFIPEKENLDLSSLPEHPLVSRLSWRNLDDITMSLVPTGNLVAV